MKKELVMRQIYDDFVNKVVLSDREKEVLIRYIQGDSIVKIATETMQGTATVSKIIAQLKSKYNNYKQLEIAKLQLFRQ